MVRLLNMAEMEFSIISGQGWDRWLDSHDTLVAEVAAWEEKRNAPETRIYDFSLSSLTSSKP